MSLLACLKPVAEYMRKRQETVRSYDTMRRTTCCNCPTGCGMKVFLKKQSIVDIFGDEEHPINKGSLCPKGLLAYRHLRNPKRLVYPQIRESLSEPFKRATWDEAMSFAAGRLRELARKHGKNSVCIHGDESGSFGYLAAGALFAKHFGTVNMPYRFLSSPYGPEGLLKKIFGVPGSQLSMNSLRDWSNSRCIILYCSDLAASDPITFGHIVDARDRGTALIVIDSKHTITASKATLSLRIKPGSGLAVLKGIMHFLIEKGMVDEGVFEESASGLPSLKAETALFSPDTVAGLSWVNEGDLRRTAELIGSTKPLQVIAADWNSRRYLSDEELSLCGAIVYARGSVGIPGGGLNLLNVSPFSTGEWIDSNGSPSHPGQDVPPASLEELLIRPEKVSALFWQGNPAARMAGGKTVKAALKNTPLVIHLSSYPNETFHHSHVSFPISSWLEYSSLVANNNGRALQLHHKVVDPDGECRSPFDFWCNLARTCGLDQFPAWEDDSGLVNSDRAVEFFLKENPLTSEASLERLDPEKNPPGGVLWPCVKGSDFEFENNRFARGDIRGRNILFQRGQSYPLADKRFPTLSGKIVFDPRDLKETRKSTAVAPPASDNDFPLILITGVLVDFVEEYGSFVSDREAWTREQTVQIHPQIGKVLEVRSGQDVTVENDRGSITAPVWLNENMDPRVIWCPEGVDPFQPGSSHESFRSLFEAPEETNRQRLFAKVSVYKMGQDRIKTTQEIVRCLETLGLGEGRPASSLLLKSTGMVIA